MTRPSRRILPGIAILLLTIAAYLPAITHGGFIWDDDRHILLNPSLRSTQGLREIWLKVGATQQYYPLVFSSFWIEYQLWRDWPLGYHAVNVLLHAASAIVLWRILTRLGMSGAWLIAAVFALHPVNVESVVWISERKNVLSGLLALLAAATYLRFTDSSRESAGFLYIAAFVLFVLALLAKTVVCTLPAALLLIVWWKRGRIARRDWLPLVPFFAIGLVMAWLTATLERLQIGATGTHFNFSTLERFLIAGRALWFYAAKIIWPAKLIFIYPRWSIDAGQVWQFAFPAAAVALVIAAFTLRHRIGRGALVALLLFGGMLVPALGFVNVYPMRYSFVADHFQYLATIGLIALIISIGSRLPRPVQIALGSLFLVSLGAATFKQSDMYRSAETVWLATAERNPRATIAHVNLCAINFNRRDYARALDYAERALALDPNEKIAHYDVGNIYVAQGRIYEAIPHLTRTVEIDPKYAEAHLRLGAALERTGDDDQAALHYRRTIELAPLNPLAYNSLASLLVRKGSTDEALRLLRLSARTTPYAATHYNIALILGRQGDDAAAMTEIEEALRIDPGYRPAQELLRRRSGAPPGFE